MRSEANDASIVRSHGAASQLIPTLPMEPTVDRMDFAPKQSNELSCPQFRRELKATQRRMEEMERSLRAEISEIREEIRANPRVALSRNNVPRGMRDRRSLTSDEEFGFKTGAEERIQDVLDRKVTPRTRRRTRGRRLSTRSDLELESSTDADQYRNHDDTPSRRHSWKDPRRRGLEEIRTAHDDFRHTLSSRTYRLQTTDSTQDRDVFAISYEQRRRIEAMMRDSKFEGSNPIEAL